MFPQFWLLLYKCHSFYYFIVVCILASFETIHMETKSAILCIEKISILLTEKITERRSIGVLTSRLWQTASL